MYVRACVLFIFWTWYTWWDSPATLHRHHQSILILRLYVICSWSSSSCLVSPSVCKGIHYWSEKRMPALIQVSYFNHLDDHNGRPIVEMDQHDEGIPTTLVCIGWCQWTTFILYGIIIIFMIIYYDDVMRKIWNVTPLRYAPFQFYTNNFILLILLLVSREARKRWSTRLYPFEGMSVYDCLMSDR